MTSYLINTPSGLRTISIDLPDEPFGVLISGGFDSTLLLHLICREIGASGRVFYTCNVSRGLGTEEAALATAQRLSERYGCVITHRQLCTNGEHADQVSNAAHSYLATGEVAKLFVADTTNPDVLPNGPNRLSPAETKRLPRWLFPFLHCDKSHMVALADQLGIVPDMIYTHTCTEWGEGECGVCWQCRERAWGFGQNGLTDPLTPAEITREGVGKVIEIDTPVSVFPENVDGQFAHSIRRPID